MGASSKGLIAAVAPLVLSAGGWWFDVSATDGALLFGGWGTIFEPQESAVAVGVLPCAQGEGVIEIDDLRVTTVAGEVETLGVLAMALSESDPAVGSSVGSPPDDDVFSDVEWQPFAPPVEVDWMCGSGAERLQLVVGLRSPQRGVARIEMDHTKGLARHSAFDSVPELVLCGPAIEGTEAFEDDCS